MADTKYVTDGHASLGFHRHVYLNAEGQNEAGSTLADASIQSVLYGHHHAHKEAKKYPYCRFPCLHMYFFGKKCLFYGLMSA